MHEYSIADSLLRMAEKEAARHGAERVLRLQLRLGELCGVEVDLLATAWSLVRQRSVCEGVELEIERVPACWRCSRCAREIERGAVLGCPDCGSRAELTCGDELVLDRIEMEVN